MLHHTALTGFVPTASPEDTLRTDQHCCLGALRRNMLTLACT
jgi:hypothetical protein